MLPSRFVPAQSNAMRKSKLDVRPSLLPKPRRPCSTDRLSSEARRPSTAGHRSSSAEPRGTFGGGRLSREASATKLPFNGRSRSQQSERFGQSAVTPVRHGYHPRSTAASTTPVRTPSEDRATRSWQTSLDRALAFVTIKDQRPISNVAWQRAELVRVQEALAGRSASANSCIALVRPLTIARFVDISGALLDAIVKNAKLNNDNYVAKLPHLSKRLLYPGTVSKSWLKTVNTLHAFPQALALIAYLLDLVNHIETPINDDGLYVDKDELACLRREYLRKCWIRFQDPGHKYEDLNEEYLTKLEHLLGNDEEKINELHQIIKKYTACLEEEAASSDRAEESRRAERRSALGAALRGLRAASRQLRADSEALTAAAREHQHTLRACDLDMERLHAENEQLKLEIESQPMSVEERTRLRDETDYALRVYESKRALALHISQMVTTKENELSSWQQKTLDSCVQYKQGLINLSAQFPHLASLAIDEKELMGSECGSAVSGAVEQLRACSAQLADTRAQHARQRSATHRKLVHMLEETRAKISELKCNVESSQQALERESAAASHEADEYARALRAAALQREQLQQRQREYAAVAQQLQHWQGQRDSWCTKLAALQDYVKAQKDEANRLLQYGRTRRSQLVINSIQMWNQKLQ